MTVFYSKKPSSKTTTLASGHIIRANTLENAKEIAERHGISNPFNSDKIIRRHFKYADRRFKHYKELIERRKRGIGGNIWYEDKNGKLQNETYSTNNK